MKYSKLKSLGIFVAVAVSSLPAYAAITAASGQYATKLYTEGLGRVPDQGSWQNIVAQLQGNTCGLPVLQNMATAVFTSAEFHATSPTYHQKAFRLYRGVLSRDATAAELTAVINAANAGVSWNSIVSSFLNSGEFQSRVPLNCSETSNGWQPAAPANLVVTQTGAITTADGLITALKNPASGSTIYLEQGATILLTEPIKVPAGVTLTTVGQPGSTKAPLLGRIARNAAFTGPMIILQNNAKLDSVWVDGQRNRFGHIGGMNVYANGSNIQVTRNILSDSTAWTHLQHYTDFNPDSPAGSICEGGYVGNNLITAYGSSHYDFLKWSDGISIGCTGAIVENNTVIDATDVSIIVYRSHPKIQNSIVRNNVIFNPGNPAFGALAADPLSASPAYTNKYPKDTILNFSGTQFTSNLIWSSPSVHFDIILADGTRPWFGDDAYQGRGASFTYNTSGSQSVTTYTAIAVSGMKETKVTNNSFTRINAPLTIPNNCGLHNIAVVPGDEVGSVIDSYELLPKQPPSILQTKCAVAHYPPQ